MNALPSIPELTERLQRPREAARQKSAAGPLKAVARASRDLSHLDDPHLVDRIMARSQADLDAFVAEQYAPDDEVVPVDVSEPVKAKRQRKRKLPIILDTAGPDDPITLENAARLAFPDGSMTVSGLRNAIRKGTLKAEMPAGRILTTLNNIKQMRELCPIGAGGEARQRNSTSANQGGPAGQGGGSSSTGRRTGRAHRAKHRRI